MEFVNILFRKEIEDDYLKKKYKLFQEESEIRNFKGFFEGNQICSFNLELIDIG